MYLRNILLLVLGCLIVRAYEMGIHEKEHSQNHKSGGYLVWLCNGGANCTAVMEYTQGAGISTLTFLKYLPFSEILAGFAVDIDSQVGYCIMGNDTQNATIITTNFSSGASSFSSNFTIATHDRVLDMQYNEQQSKLFVLLQRDYKISSLSSLEVLQVDPVTAKSSSVVIWILS